MTFTLKIVALQLVFWSALSAYLSSDRQLLRGMGLAKMLGWGVFGAGSLASLALMTRAYDWPTATAYWLSGVMLSWVLLVLATPHASNGTVLAWGASLMLVAAVLG